MPIDYIVIGSFQYNRDPMGTAWGIETDNGDPDTGIPEYSPLLDDDSNPTTLTVTDEDNGMPGFQLGQDLTGNNNFFQGTLTVNVGGEDVEMILVNSSDPDTGVPDVDSWSLAVPQGVDPVQLTAALQASANIIYTDDNFGFSEPQVNDDGTFFCFGEGTLLETSDGPVPVEQLTVDHLVRTLDGRAVPIRWIGVQTISLRFSGDAKGLVEISQGALGENMPQRPLRLTGDHALMIDGVLVNASALVNGSSVRYVPRSELGDTITVYHVETEEHEVLLAEGLPAESFIDYLGRGRLDNYAEYISAFGIERVIREMDAPRISSKRLLPSSIKSRVSAKADEAGSFAA